jgi:F0F1-type ATP synthase assembly protein I
VIIGAALGWGADRLLHSKPLFLILFFLLGVAAGIWNVIRLTSPKDAPFGHNSPLSPHDANDKDVRRPATPSAQKGPFGAEDHGD